MHEHENKNSRSSKIMPTAICNAGSSFQCFFFFSIFQYIPLLYLRFLWIPPRPAPSLPVQYLLLFVAGQPVVSSLVRTNVQSLIRHMLLICLMKLVYFLIFDLEQNTLDITKYLFVTKSKNKIGSYQPIDRWVRGEGGAVSTSKKENKREKAREKKQYRDTQTTSLVVAADADNNQQQIDITSAMNTRTRFKC